jgi:hypothetical protein
MMSSGNEVPRSASDYPAAALPGGASVVFDHGCPNISCPGGAHVVRATSCLS